MPFLELHRRQLAAALASACLSLEIHAAPLTFSAAIAEAERNAPQLQAQEAAIYGAQALVLPAGQLPDPRLIVGIDNLPVSGPDRWRLSRDFMTMQKLGVMQEVPNTGKREARIAVAQAGVALAENARKVARLAVRRETALAWIKRYYLERKLALFDELERENRLLATTVQAQLASGRSMMADAVMPRQEALMLAERRDELARDLDIASAALTRWLGSADVHTLSGEPPQYPVAPQHYLHRLQQHPDLAVYVAMTEQAQAELRQAEAGRQPDWGVAVTYQRRAPQYGDMLSLEFNIDLPILQGVRQSPQIDARRAALGKLDAEREEMLREHALALANDLAEYQRLQRALLRQQGTAISLAQEKRDLQTASYRAGHADLMPVLAARRELIDARLKAIDLATQLTQLAARLHFTLGEGV